MARTRLQIKELVRSHTGRTKDTLESSLCDSALKLALLKHPFKDAISTPSDIELTEGEYKVSISDASAFHIITARIVEADGSRNTELKIKNRTWWDKNVINAEDNTQGWPIYCLHAGIYIYFERPVQDGLELRLRITTEQTFADDSTACPIACLDLFVEKFVTYEIFMDLGIHERAAFWKVQALGPRYEQGDIGGALYDAIESDKYEIGEDLKFERPTGAGGSRGMAILNDLGDLSDRDGEVDMWYS